MADQLLKVIKLRARGNVKATAVQLPDFIMLHIQPFNVVVVQDRQAVGTWKVGLLKAEWCVKQH